MRILGLIVTGSGAGVFMIGTGITIKILSCSGDSSVL